MYAFAVGPSNVSFTTDTPVGAAGSTLEMMFDRTTAVVRVARVVAGAGGQHALVVDRRQRLHRREQAGPGEVAVLAAAFSSAAFSGYDQTQPEV